MNLNIESLVRRARELAALADEATPGPWYVRGTLLLGWDVLPPPVGRTCQFHNKSDADLMAAAPEMANLLGELADELERQTSSKSRS